MSRALVFAALAVTAESGGQPPRLRITNACSSQPIWIAHEAGAGTGPDPQNVKMAPMSSHDFTIPDNLKATRYWPKMYCDDSGNKCGLGGSGGPQEVCRAEGCAPPVDSKFEATFGQQGEPCNPSQGQYTGCDYLDVSLVDGFTLPFKFEIKGDCGGTSNGNSTSDSPKVIDCSKLDFSKCPTSENMGKAGTNINLQVQNPSSHKLAGCYSPCGKLTFRNWGNTFADHHTPDDPVAKDYCCPTPPESPSDCRAGPVPKTNYVNLVHQQCPGVYGYSYDDGMGLRSCPAGTQYEVTYYCPATESAAGETTVVV